MPVLYYLIYLRNAIQAHYLSKVFLKSYREKLKIIKNQKKLKKFFSFTYQRYFIHFKKIVKCSTFSFNLCIFQLLFRIIYMCVCIYIKLFI